MRHRAAHPGGRRGAASTGPRWRRPAGAALRLRGLVVLEHAVAGEVQLGRVVLAAELAVNDLDLEVSELLLDLVLQRRVGRDEAGHVRVSLWWAAPRRLARNGRRGAAHERARVRRGRLSALPARD